MNKKNQDLLSIKTISRLTGLSESVLRYWEKIGLISSQRTPGGHRRYHTDVIEKLKILKQEKETKGLPAVELGAASHLPVEKPQAIAKSSETSGVVINPINRTLIQRELDIRFSKGTPTAACFIELLGKSDFQRSFGQKGMFKILQFLAYLLDDTVRDYGKGDERVSYLGQEQYILVSDPKNASKVCHRLEEKFRQFFRLQLGEDEFSQLYFEQVKSGSAEMLSLYILEVNSQDNRLRNMLRGKSLTLDELHALAKPIFRRSIEGKHGERKAD